MLNTIVDYFIYGGIIMKKIILSVFGILVIGGAGAAYWFGNQPKTTYYPNGEIHTSVQQKFFKEQGEYKIFNSDGTLSQKFVVNDGVKTGKGFVYAGGVTAEVNYVNGNLSGALKLDTKNKAPELDNLQIELAAGGYTIEYKNQETAPKTATEDIEIDELSEEDGLLKQEVELSEVDVLSAPKTKISGKILCTDDEFLSNMQAFLSTQTLENFKNFARCISVTNSEFEDDLYTCKFDGSYVYPKFTADSKLQCKSPVFAEMFSASLSQIDIQDIGELLTSFSYAQNDGKFSFNISDDKNKYSNTQTFKGLEDMIAATAEYTFSKQESKDTIKLISDILKGLVISDGQLAIDGKVVSVVNGDFNFMNGFSDPWTASFFGVENTLTSQTKINAKGMVLNIAYPISQKPLFSIGLQINDKFKQQYKSALELILKEFSENTEDVAVEHLMAKLPEYSMSFSDVINSVNALLMNNRGEKVVGVVLNVKKGMDFMTAMDNLQNAFTAKIISYKNNKPSKVISGDAENGFAVDGKLIDIDDIYNYLDTNALDEVSKQMDAEFSEAYKQMKENKYPSDPFIKGFYEGYYNSMQQYKSEEAAEQAALIIENLRTVYADTASYKGLNNELAINLNTIPKDMIAQNGEITNAAGGKVSISAAPAFTGDEENLSFVMRFENLPQAGCVSLLTNQWNKNSGIIAIGANKDITSLPLDASENLASAACGSDGVLCAAKQAFNEEEALSVCKDTGNILYFKFQ